MPILRGTVHAVIGAARETRGVIGITHDTWNANLSQVGFVTIRDAVPDVERPYATELSSGGFASAARVVSLIAPPHPGSPVGPAVGVLSADELAALEERLCAFFQLVDVLAGRPGLRPIAHPNLYPLWSNVYYGPAVGGERKRYVIVSPNPWNAVSGFATGVRTTTAFKRSHVEFPPILGGETRACCGDATTFGVRAYLLDPRSRPTPALVSGTDMRRIARGLASVYELEGALGRLGVPIQETD